MFRNLIGSAEGALIRAAASTQPLCASTLRKGEQFQCVVSIMTAQRPSPSARVVIGASVAIAPLNSRMVSLVRIGVKPRLKL